jgi:hypothetical protein
VHNKPEKRKEEITRIPTTERKQTIENSGRSHVREQIKRAKVKQKRSNNFECHAGSKVTEQSKSILEAAERKPRRAKGK